MQIPLNRLALIAMFGLAGYMAWDFRQKLFENKGRLQISQSSVVEGAVELTWNSEVKLPMAKRIAEAFAAWRDKTDRFVINLHSPGGDIGEGRKVIEIIAQMKGTHRVDTYVSSRHSCLSMCVPIFLQGQNRIAATSSRWMFHQPRRVDSLTEKDVKIPKSERKAMADRFFKRYILNSEISRAWRDKLQVEWQGKEVWKTGQQLVDEKSNIITQLR